MHAGSYSNLSSGLNKDSPNWYSKLKSVHDPFWVQTVADGLGICQPSNISSATWHNSDVFPLLAYHSVLKCFIVVEIFTLAVTIFMFLGSGAIHFTNALTSTVVERLAVIGRQAKFHTP